MLRGCASPAIRLPKLVLHSQSLSVHTRRQHFSLSLPTTKMAVLQSVTLVLLAHLVQAYPYSSYSAKRYNREGHNPSYQPPVPVIPTYNAAQNYDNQEEPSRAFRPYYFYYPYRSARNALPYEDSYSEVPEEVSGSYQSAYPYGQELWYEGGPDAAANAAAAATREAILQNLIIAQMYEDAAASAAVNGFPLYQPQSDDRSRSYQYGVPTTDVDEKELARQYLMKNEADEEVKELENLRKPKESNKDGKRRRKQKNKQRIALDESPAKRDGSDPSAKQSLITLDGLNEAAASLTSETVNGGQKEFVLPQPARSRRPVNQQRRSEPSVYQTIKQLLDVERHHKTDGSRLKKRFISTEEQLTQQLNSLKRATM